jgi:hypothetical protein
MSVARFPSQSDRLRREIGQEMFEPWVRLANCRPRSLGGEGPQNEGFPWHAAWLDDVSSQAQPEDYDWPESVDAVLKACSSCAVRPQCLEAGFPESIGLGLAWFHGRHTTECNRTAIARGSSCEGCLPEERQTWEQEFQLEPMPAGIFGGVPAPIRRHFAEIACPDCAGQGDQPGFEIDGVDVSHIAAEFYPDRRGFDCERCEGSGKIARPDRLERCAEWSESYFTAQGWIAKDEEATA